MILCAAELLLWLNYNIHTQPLNLNMMVHCAREVEVDQRGQSQLQDVGVEVHCRDTQDLLE